ncbi:MAG: DUF2267 domain-containing protein [Leptolyngbyaceae cyanobacterium SL_1_1]|nr:DUF2267 domain-containing protein [Leptolyngbyaceae cyanobacterium RM1_1_2]NJO10289.1 DUF2267 domain-containing protein [Leptolyngbyaceae cyanobacterium SL_1_1]
MPINLRDDVAYILLKKIGEGERSATGKHEVNFTETDFTGRQLSKSDLLGHLDYLNQKGFIDAKFSGNAYANQEDVPDLINSDEVDVRIANTLGAEDGPLPHLIEFEKAELTEKGQRLLEKMNENPPEALKGGPATPIATENMDFLEKVMLKGELEDIFDARDLAEVVFRTMRDLMTKEASGRVASELHEKAISTEDKALQNEVAELWQDTNPIVRFLSQVRPPLEFDGDTFFFRVKQEGGLSKFVSPEQATKAVFSATKDELSQERVSEIAKVLPDKVRTLWEEA